MAKKIKGKGKKRAAIAAAEAEKLRVSNNDAAPPSPDTVPESDYDYKNDPRPVSS